MVYVSQSDLDGLIPPQFLAEALDDNQDNHEDAGLWDKIAAQASGAVDALLGQRYRVPFTPPFPSLVTQAARVFAAYALYRRRGYTDDRNPFAKECERLSTKLSRIGQGLEPLTPEADRANASVSVIAEGAKTYAGGKLIA
ncbi:phage protein Gp36 family protein [Thermosphaera sp.]